MDFLEALTFIDKGQKVILKERIGGFIIVASRQQAFKRMKESDYLSESWEIYEKKPKTKLQHSP